MADEEQWSMCEDGCLNINFDPKSIIYHPNVNVILVISKSFEVYVIDVNSGAILHKTSFNAPPGGNLQGAYLSQHHKLLLTDGSHLGLRSDYNGVLLLDSILQPPVTRTQQIVRVEIPYTEAVVLHKALSQFAELPGAEQLASEVTEQLLLQIQAQAQQLTGNKAGKWRCIILEKAAGSLWLVFSGLAQELKRQARQVPAMTVASALCERLNTLASSEGPALLGGETNPTPYRALMFSEAARRATFTKWPHMNYKWALPDQMAQAGFYHQPNCMGDDRAMCFTCNVCLVCWEPTDEPWSEHERHSPSCPFVKGESTQNVPLSVSYATQPANKPKVAANPNTCLVDCIGTTSARDLVATSSRQGHIVLWNISRHLKEASSFLISETNDIVQGFLKLRIFRPAPAPKLAWTDTDEEKPEEKTPQPTLPTNIVTEVEVTALCIAACDTNKLINNNNNKNSKSGHSCLVVGARFKPLNHTLDFSSDVVEAMNYANQSCSNFYDDTTTRLSPLKPSNTISCILVYDIQYTEGNLNDNSNINNNSNTHHNNSNNNDTGTNGATKKKGHSGTRQENNMYSDPFLSTFLYEAYDAPVIEDAVDPEDDDIELHNHHPHHQTPVSNAVKFGTDHCLPQSVIVKFNAPFTIPPDIADTIVEPNIVQCFGLPEKLKKDMIVKSINPTKDGHHILVTLGVQTKVPVPVKVKAPANTEMMDHTSLSALLELEQNTVVDEIASAFSKEIYMSMKDYLPNLPMPNGIDWEEIKMACEFTGDYNSAAHTAAKLTEAYTAAVGDCPECYLFETPGEIPTPKVPKETNEEGFLSNHRSEQQQHGAVLLYAMSSEVNGKISVQEQPLVWRTLTSSPVETLLLPCSEKEGESEVKSKEAQGLAAIVCQDGGVRILDVASLSTVATAKPSQPNANFISVTYCNSLEQLCLCSDTGKLHFFSLAVPGTEQVEEEADTPKAGERLDEPELIVTPSSSTASTDLLAYQPLTLQNLISLRQLTRCTNLTPCFTANAPACWSEMMQAQKQRRHPQHLQQGGEELHHTRTWRLQQESNTWDEHVFELTLPRSCCVGHVDVKFTLHSAPTSPIQITLLKLNSSGIGRKDKQASNLSVDETIDFNFDNLAANPVTSEYYSHIHNTEVLCGPVNLAAAIDLSGSSGIITLTSPALLACRSRTLLVHIKALSEPLAKPQSKSKEERIGVKRGRSDWSNLSEPPVEQVAKYHISNVERTVAAAKKEGIKGCDHLHEISITIRRTCRTNIPNERQQRRAMLESLSFVEQLAQVACLEGPEVNSKTQSLALDILLWVCSVQLVRYRGTQRTQQASQVELIQLIESWMVPLVLNCILLANRSVAHKFAKLCVICSEGLKNSVDSPTPTFDNNLLEALQTCLPMVPKAESAGALRWFFMLLNRKASQNAAITGQKCMTLLQQVAAELGSRNNPSHMLLRTRFSLYGLPLEPEIFDMEPPQQNTKSTSTPLSYATVVSGDASGIPVNSVNNAASAPSGGLSELRGILSGSTAGTLSSTDHHMRGLLETQPLHFTCHAASDGTKLEMPPNSDGLAVNNVWDCEGFAFPEPLANLKNSDEDDSLGALATLPWQQLLSPPAQQTLVIERMHSGARRFIVLDFGTTVALSDLFIPVCADLVSLSLDLWSVAEETDGQRLVVATDIGNKSLIMSDLQPPPICRYLKVTTIGRYGMTTARCKIPIGLYFGHMVLIPHENIDEITLKTDERVSQTHQAILQALVEDAQCRHSLACAKLKSLVAPFLQAEQPSVSHLYHFLKQTSTHNPEHQEEQKIITAYQECVAFQRQLSVVKQVLKRLQNADKLEAHVLAETCEQFFKDACTDKLRVMADCLLDTLLGLTHESVARTTIQISQQSCLELFQSLCVGTEVHTQLAACSLLVRICGHQAWWGDFLADSLVQLFGVQQSIVTFPQDRVFILLSYLGRKSLISGAKSSVLESVLKALGKLLQPLTENFDGFLRAQLDLCLIGWLLLFLSSCLDACAPDDRPEPASSTPAANAAGSSSSTSNRWTFIQGHEAMQKQMASWNKTSVSRCYSRKLHKRLMHHSQQLKELEAAKKAFQTSTQALSALSSQAVSLSSKLEAALKAQEQYLKKSVQQQTLKRWKELSQAQWKEVSNLGNGSGSSGSRIVDEVPDIHLTVPLSLLPQSLSLPVAKGLVALILHMDFTCNADLFLLACKVLSGIVNSVRPVITLSTLLSEEQLLQLVRLAVWSDCGPRALWGGPWVSHAISCLLQDLLEVRTLGMKSQDTSPSDEALETPQCDEAAAAAGSSSNNTETTEDTRDSVNIESNSNTSKSGEGMKLPSLIESEDSELEDLLEDIWVRGKYLMHRKGSSQRAVSGLATSVSTAIDARLEYGLEWNPEVMLRRMSMQGAYNLSLSIASSLQPVRLATPGPQNSWDETSSLDWSPTVGVSSDIMLSNCFDQIFSELHTQSRPTSLEQALQLWHTLAQESQTFEPTSVPLLQLQPPAVSGLIAALAWHPGITLCAWTLAFQCLTLVSNQPRSDVWSVNKIIEDRNFLLMLKRFLSGEGSTSSCGPMACRNLNQLLVRLLAQSETEETPCTPNLKEQLLQLTLQLVSPGGGSLSIRQGPLDAQCKLLEFMLKLSFENVDQNLVLNFMDAVGVLVYWTIQDNQTMACRSTPHAVDNSVNNATARCFGGLFASVLGGEPRHSRLASWDNLICSLLSLSTRLILVPTKGEKEQEENVATVSQSDEDKENSKIAGNVDKKYSALCDAVLERQASMLRFLSALAGCSGSTLAMVLGPNMPPALGASSSVPGMNIPQLNNDNLGEPLSVGDAIFNLLSTIAKHTSQPELVLKPLLSFLSSGGVGGSGGVLQLSEPLLWYILKVVSTDEALEKFIAMDGIKVICNNLVKSSSTLINTQPSLISMMMQHLYRSSQIGNAFSKKGATQLECIEGMINFAPLGCVSSSNLTTQPADTLLQSSPPHRRARTPAWSYHFYPDEAWVELTITLPCAILLKEVHLMPHLTSLATCPAAVALEISREVGSGMLPVCPPLTTSGYTFVRLHLPTPEVAAAVLIRLYKPRDSSNIGLSQIRLLGSTTFGDNLCSPPPSILPTSNVDVPDEELVTKSSLGWLRLLHFCIVQPSPQSTLAHDVVSAAAKEHGLLDACCALLLVPAPSTFAPSLERVLLHLGLHSSELGLAEINTLLHHSRAGLLQGCMPSSSSSVYSVVELLSHLCLTQDPSTKTRVGALLAWLSEVATNNVKMNAAVSKQETWTPCAAYVHAVAAILWASHEKQLSYYLSSLITHDLFKLLFEWTLELPVHGALKRAIDCVLCSMCFIDPDLFSGLLNIIGLHDLQSKSTNQNKEKTGLGKNSCMMKLTENHLMSVALACQSPSAIERLLSSGLPQALTKCILDWCSYKEEDEEKRESKEHKLCFLPDGILSIDGVAVVLNFLADVCAEGRMRDWLGSSEGSRFWLPLLHRLCNEHPAHNNSESMSAVQSAAVLFLSRCCSYHPANQQLLSQVLCDVIKQQNSNTQNLSFLHGLPGFTRRLVLQLLLESERMTLAIKAECPLHQSTPSMIWQAPRHPKHGTGHQNQLLMLRAQSTCGDVLKLMTTPGSLLPLIGGDKSSEGAETKRELWEAGMGLVDSISVAAGMTARDKRAKDVKNSATSSSQNVKTNTAASSLIAANYYCLTHDDWPGVVLPVHLTMSQLISALHCRGASLSTPGISLTLKVSPPDADRVEFTPAAQNLSTPLQVFAQMGGLALLAKHLPLVYPQALRIQPPDNVKGPSPDPMEADWVKVDVSEEYLDDLEEPMQTGSSTPKPGSNAYPLVTPSVPPHSLVAFGVFLRLPGYAEVLLRDRKKAQCLLRLVLGVSDDGEGGDIFSSAVASTLPTLPFQVLRELFDSTPLNSDDGILLRTATMDLGAIKLLLNCLAHFTHHSTKSSSPPPAPEVTTVTPTKASIQERGRGKKATDDKSHLYWAKGTGFGTGSTQQSWNVEQALQRQKGEEEYVTVLLQVISSFINPLGTMPAHFFSEDESSSEGETETTERMPLPPNFPSLIQQSCLLPAVSSYLRNDSVLDMARHIPLYSAVLQLLRAMAFSSQLAVLLLPGNDENGCRASDELSVVCLLTKMKSCVDNYASRLNSRPKKGKSKKQSFGGACNKQEEDVADQQDEEGLAQLIPDIQETANLVQLATDRLVMDDDGSHGSQNPDHPGSLDRPIQKSLEERYLEVMRKLRFDTFEMVVENDEGGNGGFRFVVSYHFEANMRAAGDRSLPSRVKRLAQETVTLATSLPLSYSSSVFVRCDTDRLDVMKVLITGPAETPYANGCFEFDVFFPPDYPSSPMLINLQTTGHHTVRFNPNLYNDGKVCLSVLNTWHGRPEEKWNAHTSSFLQVLVSIQSLILVPEPYFNEPGYERSRGTPSGTHSSREYNSNIYQATVRWAMLEQLRHPSPCFKEVVHNHFWMKRREIEQQIEGWIKEMEGQTGDRRTGRTISVNTLSLKRHYRQLKEELAKLKSPAGLEDLAVESSEPEAAAPPPQQGEPSSTSTADVATSSSVEFTPPAPVVTISSPIPNEDLSLPSVNETSENSCDPKLVQHV